ncbi:MAG: alpha/beta hydrolase [Pirellulaceae bacterium]|nr:alpha/beta hydrolase [Pirellulaceae bacterium]
MKTRSVTLFTFASVFLLAVVSSAEVPFDNVRQFTVELWPDGPPGVATALPENERPSSEDTRRITDVGRPTMTVYRASESPKASPAVLVCPGGGYRILAYDKEGTEIAEWLNSIGITAAVLKYRVPDNRDGALQDAQRAMGLLRHRADAWNLDPNRIGVIGFSAGGHLSARLSTAYRGRTYPKVDDADAESCRPDFALLVYPAYLNKKDRPHKLTDEIVVTGETPPALLVQTQDDRRYVDSSIAYYLALKKAGVPAELHLYASGGHGYGLRPSKFAVSRWPELAETWLRANRIVGVGR